MCGVGFLNFILPPPQLIESTKIGRCAKSCSWNCNLGNERRNADIGGDRLRGAADTEINGRQFNEEVSGFNHCYANSTLDTALWVR